MSWFEALILGIVQGLTEFLPVSSSGHLEIGQALLGTSGEENLTFAIVVHPATVLSTIVVFYSEILRLFKGTFTTISWNPEKDYVAKILVSMIPVFIVGMFFKDYVEQFFGSGLLLVGICLVITAILLALSDYISRHRQTEGKEVSYKSAFIIGVAQAVAVLPGLSRSGSTIATGLLCGVKKESVAQFSFNSHKIVFITSIGWPKSSVLSVIHLNSFLLRLGFQPVLVCLNVLVFLTHRFIFFS